MPALHRPLATADLVAQQFGTAPVSVADVLACGVTPGQLRAAVAAGALHRVRRGVVSASDPPGPRPRQRDVDGPDVTGPAPTGPDGPDHEVRRAEHAHAAAATLLVLGDSSIVSHGSAALLHRLPQPSPYARARGPAGVAQDVDVTAPRHGRIVAGTHRRIGSVDPRDVALLDGIPCTSIARTALDLARRRHLDQQLVPLDAAVARVGHDQVWSALSRLTWIRDLRGLRDAVAVADPLSESPLESASRGVMLRCGLPRPELQAWVTGADGRRYRLDFLWREQRVVGEADGWVTYAALVDVRAEKRREDALRQAGFTVVRWTSDELWRSPDTVMSRLRRALSP